MKSEIFAILASHVTKPDELQFLCGYKPRCLEVALGSTSLQAKLGAFSWERDILGALPEGLDLLNTMWRRSEIIN